jgi:SAM-dependent methyltransferase
VGTWRYAHEGTIATRYDEFVAGTPLCRIDLELLSEVFPALEKAVDTSRRVPNPHARGADELNDDDEIAKKKNHSTNCHVSRQWVLDLGCGTGRASAVLAANGYDVLAVDLSMPMLREVRNRGLASVVTLQANLVELEGIADDVASGAVCLFSTLGMIQGRTNRRRFLSHVRRIVRPGGRFYLHVHHRYAALTSLPTMRQLVGSAIRSVTRPDCEFGDAVYAYRGLPDMFLHQFSRRELTRDLMASGWRVARWERLSIDSARLTSRRLAGGFLVVVQ